MTSIQILATIFGFYMAYLTFLHYKRHEFSRYQFVIWEIMYIGFVVVIWFPNRLNFLTERLGIARAFDLFAIVAFMVILFLTFHNYLLITKLEKRLEHKVRKQSLDELPPKNTLDI